MKQRVVALLSLAGGLFGFGLAGLIQVDRTLLTTPRPMGGEMAAALVMPARREVPVQSKVPAPIEKALQDMQVMSLDPIFITGRRARPAIPLQRPSPQPAVSASAQSVAADSVPTGLVPTESVPTESVPTESVPAKPAPAALPPMTSALAVPDT